ncbi:family 33 glycosyltransferase [Xylaria bambusicola]|uniref:family 33 glycosyltransferase n=1 Tax=Xylaria bambusicola TaxID=326684 RepID=UPI002007D1AC|nr:family 33 glycosyltransferase [Xylaria bambusicola]KAI0520736.1 family 33 glycosyltransferase [Xylaria bambusicola]
MSPLTIILWSTFGGLFLATALVLILVPSRYERLSTSLGHASVSVQILVLGDIGRSPRMQYHALSIARHGGTVHLIGYDESPPHPDLLKNPNVTIHGLAVPPKFLRSSAIPFIISGPLKVLWQVITLLRVLGYATPASTWLLVQNPPSIPTLAISFIISILRNTQLMIDWHNYGWTILSGTKGPSHPFVALSKTYECLLGQCAPTANITVTHAMKRSLLGPPYNITESPIVTLHDRPATIFQPLASKSERESFIAKLPSTAPFAESILSGKTKLVVSSTSWTPDEDFSLLLDALVTYAQKPSRVPILAIITGKGPQKAYYEAEIQRLQKADRLPGIHIQTAWLSISDYAGLLRSADLGVCLHKSSSGVDLPMKVVDMFGSGLPVAAYSAYASFGELVREGVNGRGFETADELADILARLLGGGAENGKELATLRRGARKESELRWDEEWDRVLGRVFGFTV